MLKYLVLAKNASTGVEETREAVSSTLTVTGARLAETSDGLPHLRIEPRVSNGLEVVSENDTLDGLGSTAVSKLRVKVQSNGGLGFNASGELYVTAVGAGDVVGPSSSTDNAIVRFDGTTGKLVQGSLALITDTGTVNIPTGQTYQINGTTVLSGSALGTGILSSSLTSVGTLTNLSVANDLNVHNGGLYYDSVNDRLGIGTDQPYATLTVVSQGTNNVRAFVGEHYDNTTAFSQFKMIGSRARGTRANPSAVLANDSLASFNGRGYKTTGWSSTVGGIYVYAAENWTDTATGTYVTIRGAATGGTTVSEWARFTHVGLQIGDIAGLSSAALRIGGDIRASGTIYASDFVLTGGAGSGVGISLDNLDDVVLTSPSNGQILQYNGTNWVNISAQFGSQLTVYEEATSLTTNASSIKFVGSLVTATSVGNDVTVTLSAPAWSDITSKPTTLSGFGITDAQPLDADLTAIAGLTGTTGFLKKTAANTWTLDTATYLTGNQTVTLSGEATGSGATSIAVTLSTTAVTGKLLTGYAVGTNTALAATDTILGAFQKVQGQINARLTGNQTITLSGDATGSGATAITVSISAATVTGKLLTGYSVGANSAIAATDSILGAFQKTQGQLDNRLPLTGGTITGSITVRPAATQDAVILAGRAGGTGSFGVTITPTTLSANRTLTLANGDTTLVAGTMVPTTLSLTLNGTTGEIEVTGGAQTLAANRTWTIGLPDNVDIATSLDVGSVGAIDAAAMRVGGDIRASGTIYATDFVLTGGAGSGVGISLDNLDDVVITAAAAGEYLRYNGTNWVDSTIQTSDLGSGTANSTTFLRGDRTWAVASLVGVLDDLTDVAITSPTQGQVLRRGATEWVNSTLAIADVSGLQTALDGKLTGNQTITLSGGATGSGTTSITVTLSNTAVTGQALTGYAVGTNTALAATDTILQAFQKVQGQINARLTGNQTITLSGDVTGSGTTAITATLANSGVSAGTYRSVTVNAKGLVTGGTNPTTLAGYGITDAATNAHKYHAFGSGQYFYDNYEQANNFRLFTENATYSISRYRAVSNIEYWDQTGSVWVSWSAAQSSIEALLDGREETGMSVAHANRKFRFVVSAASGWPTLMLYFLQTTWSAITYPSMTVTLESATTAGGTYTLRDTAVFSAANTGSNWGIHARTTSALHTGDGFVRVTIDITDWVDSGAYTTVPLRRFEMLSNYAGGTLLPFSWNYSRTVNFPSTVTATTFSGPLSGNATTATTLQTARNINGTSFNGSADITTANWGTARTLTIGGTGKSVNGSANVSWTLAEIGALPLTGGTVTGTVTVQAAATQDAVRLQGRGGGTGSFVVSITPTTLSASRTLTLANGDTTLVAGTMVPTSLSLTINGTANQISVTGGTLDLSANRTWTIGLPNSVAITTSLDVGSVGAITAATMRVGGDIRASGTIYANDFVLTGGAGSGTGLSLDNLDDVVLSSPASGQYLRYNGTNWVNQTIQTADLGTGTANSTTFLRGDRTWAVASLVGVLDDLTDVTITSAAANQVLAYNGSQWVNTGSPTVTSVALSTVAFQSTGTLTTSTTTANQVVMTVSATTYRSVKYQIQVVSGTAYQVSEMLLVHDGTTAHITEYGIVRTGSNLATFDADISGGNIRLLVTPVNAATTIKVSSTALTA